MQTIKVQKTNTPKQKPQDITTLGFGQYFTDHMFMMEYDSGEGWHAPRIIPYSNISLDPAAMCLHYGQEVFEGLKAYRANDDRILLFRPEKNLERLNLSNNRLCIPQIDEALCLEAIKQLVAIDQEWVPHSLEASLYIRPFIFAIDPFVGVRPADHFLFIILLSPVGAYYPEGLNPVKIFVEQNYVRAVRGGTGFAKTAANYASSLKAQEEAKKMDYTQVLWLDGIERKYIEEVGTMNVFFLIDGEVITPSLDMGSILSGITRMSSIDLLRSWGLTVTERRISIDEIQEAAEKGTLQEAFGTGTAAVISPIGQLKLGEQEIIINNGKIGSLSQKLYDSLTGIQWGELPDTFNWTTTI